MLVPVALVLSLALLAACSREADVDSPTSGAEDVTVLAWEALMPPEWQPDEMLAEFDAADLSDVDPRSQEIMDRLKAVWDEAPAVEALDGKQVKLPGFVVPLDMNAQSIHEFLLVPYFGACVHVPPPPANQTVYVVTDEGREYAGRMWDTVWVTGTMNVEVVSSDLGRAGYRLQARQIDPYQVQPGQHPFRPE
jgi:hypothetical protein